MKISIASELHTHNSYSFIKEDSFLLYGSAHTKSVTEVY